MTPVTGVGADGPVARDAERDRLLSALAGTSDPSMSVVLVVGDPGTGKSFLVRDAVARSGAPAVVVEGDPAETGLDYGVLDQLVRRAPPGAPAVDDLVPAPTTDPLAAGATLMRFVDGLSLVRPLVVVVEDAHWADRPSLDALTFAARRLRGDQAVLCVTCRADGLDRLPPGLLRLVDPSRRIDLSPLDARAVAELAAHVTGARLPTAAAERLTAHTGGNPLHVTTLLRELPAGHLGTGAPLPAPRSYATLVLGRLAGCGAAARRLVEALAVLDRHPALTTVMVVAGLDPGSEEGLTALDEALAAEMVVLVEQPGERTLAFAHPLVGAAVRDDQSASRRQALHRAAGAVVSGAAGMRHRLAGCAGHDAAVAEEAGAVARSEAARGAYSSAARLWIEAARVSPDPAWRDDARLHALDNHLLAGDLAAARRDRAHLDEAVESPLRSFIAGRLAYVLGPRSDAEAHLGRAWQEVTRDVDPIDPELAARIAALRATTAVDRADGAAGLLWARRSLALAHGAAADCNPGHMLAMSCALEGQVRTGIEELSAVLAEPPDGPVALTDLHLGRGVLRMWAHELGPAANDLAACLGTWGTGGVFVARETARFFLAELHHRAGRLDDAIVAAETAVSIVAETDQVWLAAFPHAIAVLPLAVRGEWDRADAHLAASRAAAAASEGGAAGLWAAVAAVRLAESRQDPAGVIAACEALGGTPARRLPRMDEAILPWRATFAEALAAVDRIDDARRILDWLERDTDGATNGLVLADVARARIVVDLAAGDLGAAAATAAAARMPAQAGPADPGPFARARLESAASRAWRAVGDADAAAAAATAARGRFESLRAAPWVAVVDELTVGGGRRRPVPVSGAELTAQEQAVVHVVARGASNREAADELFLSVKTVEHHLSRAYAKLGVRSRTQLAGAIRALQPSP